jgi:hypothetical protein
MDIQIDKEIIDQSSGCKKTFACLNGGVDCLVKVKYSTEYDVLFFILIAQSILVYTAHFLETILSVVVPPEMKSINSVKCNYPH